LFVPLSFFANIENFSKSLLLLIYGIIIAAIKPITNDQIKYQPILLKDIIKLLSEDNSSKDISREFMPYIMNMLGKIYLCDAKDNLNDKNIEIVENLFETALKDIQFMRFPIYYGCVFNNLGQLFEAVSQINRPDSFAFLRQAIKHYQEAQKYLNKNYPYDYGLISYRLACLYFEYWKHTNDLQALRDSVFNLREAEKIFTYALFPECWSDIEGLLGQRLNVLSSITKNDAIADLSVNAFKNQQKVITEKRDPFAWAKIQENIGNIYYRLGREAEDRELLEESLEYFHDALYIFENMDLNDNTKRIMSSIAKTSDLLGS
jgi:tetratricopeptide (TPR) repeat protein